MVEWPDDLSEGWPYQAYLDGAALDGAVVRSRRPGDRIHPLGGPGSKKLQDLYVDRKIDRADRELPVIARGSEILFAVGAGLSERAKAAIGGRWSGYVTKKDPERKIAIGKFPRYYILQNGGRVNAAQDARRHR